MKKSCIITAIVTLILIITFVIFFRALDFSTPPIFITGYNLGVKSSIKFFHAGGSLSASCIQVRKVDNETNEEYLLEQYDRYDNMIGYSLRRDTLTIYLRKGYWIGNRSSNFVECDTFHLNINDVKWKIK